MDAIESYCLAIRRDALQQVGGFDHRFRFYRNADLDLSFAIRANGWTALATQPLPLARHEHRGWTAHDPSGAGSAQPPQLLSVPEALG